jgi:integrase
MNGRSHPTIATGKTSLESSAGDALAAALAALSAAVAKGPAALVGVVKALASEGRTGDARGQAIPDNDIVDDDASGVVLNPKGEHMPRYYGPHRHGDMWWILKRVPGQKQQVHDTYETEEEGKRAIRRLRAEARKNEGPTVSQALDLYAKQLKANGLKEHSVETTIYHLTKMFAPVAHQPLALLTSERAKDLLANLTDWSVDTRRNTLAEAKTFCKRAKANGWTELEPMKDLEGEGKRKRGKAKLTKDEARRYLNKCRELARDPKHAEAAIAAAIPILLGYRASEVVDRQVRDLDDGGTVLRVPAAKSQAGIRSQKLPEWFQPLLASRTQGKGLTDRIFEHDRSWLLKKVKAMCRMAGVPEISAHGLRGTHADLFLHAHVTALAVSQALGHASTDVTFGHYANRRIVDEHEQALVLSVLAPTVPSTETELPKLGISGVFPQKKVVTTQLPWRFFSPVTPHADNKKAPENRGFRDSFVILSWS